MKLDHSQVFSLSVAALVSGSCIAGEPLEIDWVTVGHPGNPSNPETGFGSVEYVYQIGKYEVTNDQYAAFLNAVAASDPNELYNSGMATSDRGGIVRSGDEGSFAYAPKANMGNKPVIFLNFYDMARMCNWLSNGQGSGDTESGVYTFDENGTLIAVNRDLANADQVFLPTRDEWHKAAFYQPVSLGGDIDSYWLYATGSNNTPVAAVADVFGNVSNSGPDVVNHNFGADWNGENGNFTTVGSCGSPSYYGAFDMNGNARERYDIGALFQPVLGGGVGATGCAGGNYRDSTGLLQSDRYFLCVAAANSFLDGFRLARNAPPACVADLDGNDILDLADISIFVLAFVDQAAPADLAAPFGVWDLEDITGFVESFNAGCP